MYTTVDSRLTVNIQRLLAFFDAEISGSEGHATALVAVAGEDLGVGLLQHYLHACDAQVEILPDACTQGTQKSVRLDRWVRVYGPGRDVL